VPHDEWLFRIEDMIVAAETILDFTKGKSFDDFTSSPMLLHAVLHDFAIIGEAAGHVPDEVTARYPDVPWDQMRAMRDVIVHEYGAVRTITIWETIESDLKPAIDRLRAIIEREG